MKPDDLAFARPYSIDGSRLDDEGHGTRYFHEAQQGMTIRAYMATEIMTAMVVRYGINPSNADDSVHDADALIAALNKTQS